MKKTIYAIIIGMLALAMPGCGGKDSSASKRKECDDKRDQCMKACREQFHQAMVAYKECVDNANKQLDKTIGECNSPSLSAAKKDECFNRVLKRYKDDLENCEKQRAKAFEDMEKCEKACEEDYQKCIK